MTATADDYVRAVESGADGLAAFYAGELEAPVLAERVWESRADALAISALYYARQGLRVLPLRAGSKIPLGGSCCWGAHERGCTDATDDPLRVETMWDAHPTANLGIATGHRVDVIDQDGPEGALSWALMGRADAWPAVLGVALTVRPEGGGVHRYVAATGDGNGAKIAPGTDYRGRGGYVVAPPSIIDGRRYRWVQPLDLEGTR